jgi:hypothetical protein
MLGFSKSISHGECFSGSNGVYLQIKHGPSLNTFSWLSRNDASLFLFLNDAKAGGLENFVDLFVEHIGAETVGYRSDPKAHNLGAASCNRRC